MSREEKKYITKLVQKGAEDGSSSDVEYIIKDSEARAELTSINETIGNTRQISGFEDITTCINGLNTEVDTIQDNIGSLNNISIIAGKNKPIVENINRIDNRIDSNHNTLISNIGQLSSINDSEGKNNSIVKNINRIDNNIGQLSSINDSEGKNNSIVENINRIDERLNTSVGEDERLEDRIRDIEDILPNKISGIIIDSTDIAREPDDDGIVNLNGDITLSTINITYDELVRRRNNNALVPGQKYRITDYVTKVLFDADQQVFDSAEHQFDIIVEALSENTLSENAKAINHKYDNPEEDYFRNCNLSAWELKYCIDNDDLRFDWAFESYGNSMPNSKHKQIYGQELDSNNKELLYYYQDLNKNLIRLWFDQSTGEDNDYSSNEQIRGWGKVLGPNEKDSQLCLYPKSGEDSLNKEIAYFYYGNILSTDPEYEDGDGLPVGEYWRKAEKVNGKFVWSERKDNIGTSGGAIILVTEGLELDNVDSNINAPRIKFRLSNIIIDHSKGVIYYMKDEWENEAPFDFKNIRRHRSIMIVKEEDSKQQIAFSKNLFSSPQPNTQNPTLIQYLSGYWYLFSGLKANKGNNYIFLDSRYNIIDDMGIVKVNPNYIIDLSMYNNSDESENLITVIQNTVKPHHVRPMFYSYSLPGNIFISLFIEDEIDIANHISGNILNFSCASNIFISDSSNPILGNILNPSCFGNNFYRVVRYKFLQPGTSNQKYFSEDNS